MVGQLPVVFTLIHVIRNIDLCPAYSSSVSAAKAKLMKGALITVFYSGNVADPCPSLIK